MPKAVLRLETISEDYRRVRCDGGAVVMVARGGPSGKGLVQTTLDRE